MSADGGNRRGEVVTPVGATWRYRYDPIGRRIAKQRLDTDGTAAEETRFTWHGPTLIEQSATATTWPGVETLTWEHDETGLTPLTQTRRYRPTADAPPSETDTRFYAIITDLIGSPTHLVDETGEIAWEQHSTLWGTTTWSPEVTAYTPLRFPGQYHDLETGHHYNVHRYYDPETARYLSPDPLGLAPDANPVAYVADPQTWIDPLGLSPCTPSLPWVQHQGGHAGNTWTADLSHVTGKTARSGNRAIDAMIRRDFPDLNLTYRPQFSPWVRTGIAKPYTGTHVGWTRFSSTNDLRNSIVHEELHHRWFARGVLGDHHPRDFSGTSDEFYGIVGRYMRMRGWL